MHMLSRKDLISAELETVRVSESPTTVVRANGEVQTNDEATVYVKELDLFVTVMLLEDTPAVLSQKPQLIRDGRRTQYNTENYVPNVVPGLSSGSTSSATPPASLPQDSLVSALRRATERSESTSCQARNTANYVPFVAPSLSTSSSSSSSPIFTYFSYIFIAGNRDSHGAACINKK